MCIIIEVAKKKPEAVGCGSGRLVWRVVGLVFVFLLVVCLFTPLLTLGVSVPPEENTWIEVAPMQQARSNLGAAAVEGKLYAIGGLNTQGSVGAVEMYDPQLDAWVYKSSMPTPRYDFAIAVFMGKIYCMGGFTGERFVAERSLDVVEAYDPVSDSWETKSPLLNHRTMGFAIVVNGSLYLMGGRVSEGGLDGVSAGEGFGEDGDVVEAYDPLVDVWSEGSLELAPGMSRVAVSVGGVMAPRATYCLRYGLLYPLYPQTWFDCYFSDSDRVMGAVLPRMRDEFAFVVMDDLIYAMGGNRLHSSVGDVYYPFVHVYVPFGYGRVAPVVSVLSLEHMGEYEVRGVPLVFGVNRPVVWMGYSLDGQANVTVRGNVSLSGLSIGVHNVTVFAEDGYGNVGASKIITFVVVSEILFPLSIVGGVVVVGVVVGVCVGLFLFLRKHRRPNACVL
jgi:hypothetical protein